MTPKTKTTTTCPESAVRVAAATAATEASARVAALRQEVAETTGALAEHERATRSGARIDVQAGIALTAESGYLSTALAGAEAHAAQVDAALRDAAAAEAQVRLESLAGGMDAAKVVREQADELFAEGRALLAAHVERRNAELASVADMLTEAGCPSLTVDKPADGGPVGTRKGLVHLDGRVYRPWVADDVVNSWTAAALNGDEPGTYTLSSRRSPETFALAANIPVIERGRFTYESSVRVR